MAFPGQSARAEGASRTPSLMTGGCPAAAGVPQPVSAGTGMPAEAPKIALVPGAATVQFTRFMPVERATPAEVVRQGQRVVDLGAARLGVELLPFGAALLNPQRQIVVANQMLADMLGRTKPQDLIGARVGEVFRCRYAAEPPGGCGTTEACSGCGAALAIQAAQFGSAAQQECRIASGTPGHDLDLRVWTRPLTVAGEQFTFFTLIDISHEKRREALERIFFHDVLNTAGGLQGIVSLFAKASPEERDECLSALVRLTGTLVDEIKAQRDLGEMESGELSVTPRRITSGTVMESVATSYREHDVAAGRTLSIAADADDVAFVGDPVLLGRVLGNMVKNALEASPVGGRVTVGCRVTGRELRFEVHNSSVMPRAVQLQVFARSFSTKGKGRGLGAYSMRLLTERYLGGRVWFSSAEGEGTTFYAQYPLEPAPVG